MWYLNGVYLAVFHHTFDSYANYSMLSTGYTAAE